MHKPNDFLHLLLYQQYVESHVCIRADMNEMNHVHLFIIDQSFVERLNPARWFVLQEIIAVHGVLFFFKTKPNKIFLLQLLFFTTFFLVYHIFLSQ